MAFNNYNLRFFLFSIILIIIISINNALQCYQCGQYNDGVGSITPCLNYTEKSAALHLKECPRSSDKFCIKYVSELSIVRDCVAKCEEKEYWESRTYCCNEDGCNAAFRTTSIPSTLATFMPVIFLILIVTIH